AAVLILQFDRRYPPGGDHGNHPREVPTPQWLRRLTAGAAAWRCLRPWGLLGSGPTTALYLALVLPLAPVWLWPVIGTGIFLPGSALACLAAILGASVMYPRLFTWFTLPILAPALAAAVLLASRTVSGKPHHYRGARWLERLTTHGASLDGLRIRMHAH